MPEGHFPGLTFWLNSQILMNVSVPQFTSLYPEKTMMSTILEIALELSTPLYGLLGLLLHKTPRLIPLLIILL